MRLVLFFKKSVVLWYSLAIWITCEHNDTLRQPSDHRTLNSEIQNFETVIMWRAYLNEHILELEHSNAPGNCRSNELARLGTTIRRSRKFASVGASLATCEYTIVLFCYFGLCRQHMMGGLGLGLKTYP